MIFFKMLYDISVQQYDLVTGPYVILRIAWLHSTGLLAISGLLICVYMIVLGTPIVRYQESALRRFLFPHHRFYQGLKTG